MYQVLTCLDCLVAMRQCKTVNIMLAILLTVRTACSYQPHAVLAGERGTVLGHGQHQRCGESLSPCLCLALGASLFIALACYQQLACEWLSAFGSQVQLSPQSYGNSLPVHAACRVYTKQMCLCMA